MSQSKNVVVLPPKKEIEGVKYPIALKIATMLEQGRRYFGSSGASLTHQAFNVDYANNNKINPTLAKIGLEGERDTTTVLKKWIADKPNAVLVDSVHIRGWGKEEVDEETGIIDGGDTDHLLIVGNEVILIDTKRWKGKRNYSVGDNGEALRSNKPFPGGNLHMRQAIHMWLNFLDEDASITGIVCVNAEETTVFRNRNWYTQSYRLVELGRFTELLDEKWKSIDDYDKEHINSTLVSQIVVNAVKPFDPRDRVFSKEALAAFK